MKKIWITGFFVLATGVAAISQEEDKICIKNKLSAGASLKDGNTKSVTANISFLSEMEKSGLGSIRAGAEGNYGESEVNDKTDTTVEDARAFGNVRKTISPMTFAYVESSILYDYIARIDYRATVGPGLGAYLVKNKTLAFSIEAGPSYIWERVDGERDNYLSVRFAERCDYALSESSKIWQSVEYLPKVDNFGHFLLNAEVGVEAAMNKWMSLRVVFQDKYNSTPGEGLKENDMSLIAGVSVALSRNCD